MYHLTKGTTVDDAITGKKGAKHWYNQSGEPEVPTTITGDDMGHRWILEMDVWQTLYISGLSVYPRTRTQILVLYNSYDERLSCITKASGNSAFCL